MKRKLFWLPLAAALLAALALAASAADAGEIAVLRAQRLDAGAAFDPDTAPEADSVKAGDAVVLTIGFRNRGGITAQIAGFGARLLYDGGKAAPYAGAAPFDENPYAFLPALEGEYGWMCMGNAALDGEINAVSTGLDARAVRSGAEMPLVRVAFRFKADADDALSPFRFDPNDTYPIIDAPSAPLTLDVRGASGEKLSAADLRGGAEILPEISGRAPESPLAALSLAAYDSRGKMVAFQQWEADLSQPIPAIKTGALPESASRVKFILSGENFKPLAAQTAQ